MSRCEENVTIDVTSKDLHLDSAHPEVVPIGHKDFGGDSMVNVPVVVVKMRKGQELKLRAVAVKVMIVRLLCHCVSQHRSWVGFMFVVGKDGLRTRVHWCKVGQSWVCSSYRSTCEKTVVDALQRNIALLKVHVLQGIGKDHAKWSPVATARYCYVPDITINESMEEKMTETQKKMIISSCPAGRCPFRINHDGKVYFSHLNGGNTLFTRIGS